MVRAALDEARAAGWYLRPSSGHTFGRLRCLLPENDPGGVACKVPVYTTAGPHDGSDSAKVIRAAIRKCPHHTPISQDAERMPNASGVLGIIERIRSLIVAAEALKEKEEALGRANEALEEAIYGLDEDPEAMYSEFEREALHLEHQAAIQDARAYQAAFEGGAHDPWPPSRGELELVSLAEQYLEEARSLVESSHGETQSDDLSSQLSELQGRCQAIADSL